MEDLDGRQMVDNESEIRPTFYYVLIVLVFINWIITSFIAFKNRLVYSQTLKYVVHNHGRFGNSSSYVIFVISHLFQNSCNVQVGSLI